MAGKEGGVREEASEGRRVAIVVVRDQIDFCGVIWLVFVIVRDGIVFCGVVRLVCDVLQRGGDAIGVMRDQVGQ